MGKGTLGVPRLCTAVLQYNLEGNSQGFHQHACQNRTYLDLGVGDHGWTRTAGVEIYSTKDGTGRKLSVHKERVGPGVTAYFIDVSTPSGGQRCALSATSASVLRALLWSVRADAPEPASEILPPISSTLHAVD